jgi:L-asparaginase
VNKKKQYFTPLAVSVFLAWFFVSYSNNALARQPNIVILATGGTIAGQAPSSVSASYKAAQLSIQSLLQVIPEIKKLAKVTGEEIAQIDSVNMTAAIWLRLARRANELLASATIDGIVITHGTDTLEETAYFLDLTIKSNKPVVITGAMRPANGMSADGKLNLYNAIALAANPHSRNKGVLVTLNDTIQSARDVTKTNTTNVDTFHSADAGNLGKIVKGRAAFYHKPLRKNTLLSEFDVSQITTLPKVDVIYGYADEDPYLLQAAINAKVDGIVIAGVGDGNISDSMLVAVKKALRKGIIIARSSRTGSGQVDLGEKKFDEQGIIVADNLNPQKARILLMLALTKTHDVKKIQKMFFEY